MCYRNQLPVPQGYDHRCRPVVCNFSGSPDSIRVSVDLLFGTIKPYPTTKMPIDLSPKRSSEEAAPAPKKPEKKKQTNVWGGKC